MQYEVVRLLARGGTGVVYLAVVTPTGTDRSAEPHVLERSGSF